MANLNCCPTCGRPYPKAKAPATLPDDTAGRYAYFKATAPLEDAKFALTIGAEMSDALRLEWALHVNNIELGIAGTASQIHKRTCQLQERRRIELLQRPPADQAERAFWAHVSAQAAKGIAAGMVRDRLGWIQNWPPSDSAIEDWQRRKSTAQPS